MKTLWNSESHLEETKTPWFTASTTVKRIRIKLLMANNFNLPLFNLKTGNDEMGLTLFQKQLKMTNHE